MLPVALLLLWAAAGAAGPAPACPSAGGAPACASVGGQPLWVASACVAEAQGLKVLDGSACRTEQPDGLFEEEAEAVAAAVAAADGGGAGGVPPVGLMRKHGRQFVYRGVVGRRAFSTWRVGRSPANFTYTSWSTCIIELPSRHWWCSVPTRTAAAAGGAAGALLEAAAAGGDAPDGSARPPLGTCLPANATGANLMRIARGLSSGATLQQRGLLAGGRRRLRQDAQPAFYGPTDGSVLVSNAVFPFTSVARVEVEAATNSRAWPADWSCSGVLVSRAAVLTAGHCTFKQDYTVRAVRVYVGSKVDPDPPALSARAWRYLQGYADNSDAFSYDIGLLELEAAVPRRFAPVPVLSPLLPAGCWQPRRGDTVSVSGYPGETRGKYDPADGVRRQWMHSCLFKGYGSEAAEGVAYGGDGRTLTYSSCDAEQGQSGGPVFFTWRDEARRRLWPVVYAVIVGGWPGPNNGPEGYDVERRVDTTAWAFIKANAGEGFGAG